MHFDFGAGELIKSTDVVLAANARGNRLGLLAPSLNHPSDFKQLLHEVFIANLWAVMGWRVFGTISVVRFLLIEGERPALAFDVGWEENFIAIAIDVAFAF